MRMGVSCVEASYEPLSLSLSELVTWMVSTQAQVTGGESFHNSAWHVMAHCSLGVWLNTTVAQLYTKNN